MTREIQKFLNIPLSRVLVSASALTFVTACATAPAERILVDSIQFKGDDYPAMTSADHTRRNYANLTEGETVVVAISDDKTGAISQPNLVGANITEVIAENKERSMEQLRSRCDVDSDGIWDSYCPQLLNEIKSSETENVVMFKSVYTISSETSGRDTWGTETGFDRNDVVDQGQPLYVRLLTVNEGNKDFSGDLDIIVNIPPQVNFTQVRDLYKVSSNAKTKAVVGGLLGALTTASAVATGNPYAAMGGGGLEGLIKNYNRMGSYQNFDTQTIGKKLKVTAKDINIEPSQGVELIYEVSYQMPDQ